MSEVNVDGYPVHITNPDKLMWPKMGIRKIDYITKLVELAPYILPHARNRLLTVVRYPDGVDGTSFFQKNTPDYAPDWLETSEWNKNHYTLLNTLAALVWLGNQAVLEFHTGFNRIQKQNNPTDLVFDLDPSEGQHFDDVAETALLIHETLMDLNIRSWIKTSGATGLQLYIPVGSRYDYDTARTINEFFGRYFSQRYPDIITIERRIKNRGSRLYFDYLQMWAGKTITMVYSPRAATNALISMPVTWEEVQNGIHPQDFHLLNAGTRLKEKGDLFQELNKSENIQNLDFLLQHIQNH
ncbi:MAG TPA: DNA polymerase domain-containing protein [Clostridiales bacterium]|nr:DNA polymerase domain-containing protein [Clostridiales bacterium]